MKPEQHHIDLHKAVVDSAAHTSRLATAVHDLAAATKNPVVVAPVTDLAGAPISLVTEGEFINSTACTVRANAVDFRLNPILGFHKIFLYLETNRTPAVTADFFIEGNVTLWRNNKAVVILPASIGIDVGAALLGKTLYTAFANPTTGVPEAMGLALQKTFTTSATPIVTPARVTGIVDRATYSVTSVGISAGNSFSNFRAFLIVHSSYQPF